MTNTTNTADLCAATQAAAELRRLHAENESLRAGYDAARLEIASLRERVRQLGQAARQPLTGAQVQQLVITVCDSIYPQDNASYSEADSVFYGAFARAIEHHHGIK